MINKKHLLNIFLIFIVWRIFLFGVGFVADYFLPYAPSFPYYETFLPGYSVPRWIYSWANFDGVHYLTIAEKGYFENGFVQAFFPLYPYIMLHGLRVLISSKINAFVFALFLSNLFAFLLSVTWFSFLNKRWGAKFAYLGLLVLLLFPGSLYLGAVYTEPLCLLLTIIAFYSAQKGKWGWAASAAALASASRVVGVFVVPGLMFELWWQWLEKHPGWTVQNIFTFIQNKWKTLGLLSLGSLGLFSYMLFLHIFFDDALYFFHVQSEFGSGRQETLILYPQVVWRAIKILVTVRPIDLKYYAYVQETFWGTVGLLGILGAFKVPKVRVSSILFALAAFFLPILTGNMSGLPRYILISFPLFFFITYYIQKRTWLMVLWFSLSTLLLVFNTILFIQGYWLA